MTLKRSAQAVWQGNGKDGKGFLTTDSQVLKESPYSFHTRFENSVGTNPEELIAAAHAACFTMALSFMLSGGGISSNHLSTRASVSLDKTAGNNWEVGSVHLEVEGNVPGLEISKFQEFAEKAKASCPISKLLNAKITLSAKLQQSQAA